MNITIPKGYLEDGDEVTIVVKLQRAYKSPRESEERTENSEAESSVVWSKRISNDDCDDSTILVTGQSEQTTADNDHNESATSTLSIFENDQVQMDELPVNMLDNMQVASKNHIEPVTSASAIKADREHNQFMQFIEGLRKRQQKKEIFVEKHLANNSHSKRCTYTQLKEFRCMAIFPFPNHFSLSQHLIAHTTRNNIECAFCSASYNNMPQFERHLDEDHGNFTYDEHKKYEAWFDHYDDEDNRDETYSSGSQDAAHPRHEDKQLRNKLLKIHAASLIRFPPPNKNDETFKNFIDDLRQRQMDREIELDEMAKGQPNAIKCDHDQDAEFKCLAYYVGEVNMNAHQMAHKISKTQSPLYAYACEFCGAAYGNFLQFMKHLEKHHGGFTSVENEKYKAYKMIRK